MIAKPREHHTPEVMGSNPTERWSVLKQVPHECVTLLIFLENSECLVVQLVGENKLNILKRGNLFFG